MFRERLLVLLNDKDSYSQDEYYRLCRSIAKLFLEDEERSVKYVLEEATDEDIFLLGEFLDEILRLTINDKLYKAFRKRAESMLEDTKDALAMKNKVYECLKYSWI